MENNEHPQARALRRARKKVSVAQSIATVTATVSLWITTPPGAFATSDRPPFFAALTYAAILAVCYELLLLPFRVWRENIERRFGLSTQTWRNWILDHLKGYALAAFLGAIAVSAVTASVCHFGENWWWITALAATLFGIVLTRVAPQLILPLFFKLKPIESPELKAKFPDLPIFEIDLSRRTKAANAAVIGFGKTRKAVVGDTLLAEFSPDEVGFVLQHELAHHRYHDLWTGIAVGSTITFIALATTNMIVARVAASHGMAFPFAPGSADSFYPIVLFWIIVITSVVETILSPLAKLYSRFVETRADRFAAETFGKPEAGANAFRKLGYQNMAVFNPPRWEETLFYTHPSIARRIKRILISNT